MLKGALDTSEKALRGYSPAPLLGEGHEDDPPNALADDPAARREYVRRILA